MEYSQTLKDIIDKNDNLKHQFNQVLNNLKQERTTFSFNRMNFSKEMDLTKFSQEELVLGHTYLHNLFSKERNNHIKDIHTCFIAEMEKKNIKHQTFDKLDQK